MVTKKAAAKTQPKKAAPARRSTKAPKRVLARAEGEQCFWVNNGQILGDLLEFANALESMPAQTFSYHVQDARNDFADWIEFVLGDTELAGMLRGIEKPRQARTVVVRRLKIYDVS